MGQDLPSLGAMGADLKPAFPVKMHDSHDEMITERPGMSKPSQPNAVLVAIRTPRMTAEEQDSSLQELTR